MGRVTVSVCALDDRSCATVVHPPPLFGTSLLLAEPVSSDLICGQAVIHCHMTPSSLRQRQLKQGRLCSGLIKHRNG